MNPTDRPAPRFLTARYSLQQSFYWMAVCGLFSFAAAFLLQKGFNTAQTGIILALANLLSCVVQPLVAALADRFRRLTLTGLMAALAALSAAAVLAFRFLPLPPLLFAALYLTAALLLDATQSLLNALCVWCNARGLRMDYGVGRGVGSLAFAFSSVGIGRAMQRFGADAMPLIVLALLAPYLLITLTFPKIKGAEAAEQLPAKEDAACSLPEFFRRYRRFCLSLGGILLLGAFHAMTENYLITLMESLGGGSEHVGVALAVATVFEVPVLLFFVHLRRRLGTARLLRIAAMTFFIKSVFLLFAPSIFSVYLAQILQTTSYGFLSPSCVFYAQEQVSRPDMVKGQAMITAAYALGCGSGSFLGGQMIMLGGIRALLLLGVGLTLAGTAVLFLTVRTGAAARRQG